MWHLRYTVYYLYALTYVTPKLVGEIDSGGVVNSLLNIYESDDIIGVIIKEV